MSNIIEITHLAAPELYVFARLTEAQLRSRRDPDKGIFISESIKVIQYALDAGCEPLSLLMERRQIEGQAAALLAQIGDVPVYTADRDVLAGLTGYELTRGVLCAMRRPAPVHPAQVCAAAHRVAVAEGIVDPTNLGAMFRSAAALGMDAVLLSPTCCDPLSRRAARVSMGTVFQIPWARFSQPWPREGLALLKEQGFKTAAMALSDTALSVDDPRLAAEDRLAVLLGTEGTGLLDETISACDYTVCIPMYHGVDSLNVAAASAVAFWQLRKKS